MKIKCLFLLYLLFLGFNSCQKPPEFSNTPVISLPKIEKSYIDQTGDLVKLSFDFTDGNGDLGLGEADTIPPYWVNKSATADFNNIIIKMFKKENNIWKEIIFPDFDLSGQFTRFQKGDKSSPLKGTIEYNFTIFNYFVGNSNLKKNDTIKFDIYIRDRALNNSNTISTNPTVLTLK
jgi:hypothetical protein